MTEMKIFRANDGNIQSMKENAGKGIYQIAKV